ncbi:MAG: hypothetical protein IKQ31_00625 [Clostridia bacterium]|nr:hypothetical protein [Clostridia bacterium]
MAILICYKNYKLGKLDFDGETYLYTSLPDSLIFAKKYPFIDFPLAKVQSEEDTEMPYFFEKFVENLVFNESMNKLLDINLERDTYFDVLSKYAKLNQDKNTFYYELA